MRAVTLAKAAIAALEDIKGRDIVVLDVRKMTSLFDKIVVRRRGGFCYELNGLFAAALRELGFEVAMLSACVISVPLLGPE